MRRVAAHILAGFALVAASVAWVAFAARFTILDAGRSERIAAVVVDQPVVRDAAAGALSRALSAALPAEALVSTPDIERIARAALDDPRALDALRAAAVASHQRLVGAAEGPIAVDASGIAQAGRDALVAAHPEVARFLPAAPPLAVELPTDDLPDLGWLPARAAEARDSAVLAAALLLTAALLIASDRPKVLRRAGRWAVGAGIGWVLLGWLAPYAIARSSFDQLAAIGAVAAAVARPMLIPAGMLSGAGILAIAGSGSWQTARLASAAFSSVRYPGSRRPGGSPPPPPPASPYPPRLAVPPNLGTANPYGAPAPPEEPGGGRWL